MYSFTLQPYLTYIAFLKQLTYEWILFNSDKNLYNNYYFKIPKMLLFSLKLFFIELLS